MEGIIKMSRKIVAFAGVQGSGKDYRCTQFVKQGNYKKMAFADALRKIAFTSLGIPVDKGMNNYEWLKANQCISVSFSDGTNTNINFRKFLEFMGTEGIRYYDNDFWCKCLVKDIEDVDEDLNICISDLRFYNEYKYIKEYCDKNNYEFSFIFCDYHSDRYNGFNEHASARLANFLKEIGYSDGDTIKDEDMQIYIESMDALVKS